MEERRSNIEQLNKLTEVPYTEIKLGEETAKVYKSLVNKRLEGETFEEYKLRQYINRKTVQKFKQGVVAKNEK